MGEGDGVGEGACVEVGRAVEEELFRLKVQLPRAGLERELCGLGEAGV